MSGASNRNGTFYPQPNGCVVDGSRVTEHSVMRFSGQRTAREARPSNRPAEIYRSTKTYDHNEGLSCCFRQWRADHSHCHRLHGYALAFRFVFATHELDKNNWCLDFGALKGLRGWLHEMFDHTTIIAGDDPQLATFEALAREDLIDLRVMPAVGCEATASFVFDYVENYIREETNGRVWIESVEVREHGGNSAIFERPRA